MKKVYFISLCVVAALGLCSFARTNCGENEMMEENIAALAAIPEEEVCYNIIAGIPGCYVLYCPECRYIKGTPVSTEGIDRCARDYHDND